MCFEGGWARLSFTVCILLPIEVETFCVTTKWWLPAINTEIKRGLGIRGG